jgi:transcriptional regulator with XRE-family HTH domain
MGPVSRVRLLDRKWLLPDFSSSAIRRRLATELRRLREQTGLSGDEVADRLGWSGSKISRIETHRTGIKKLDLAQLLDLYQVEEDLRGQLTALAGERESRGWWAAYADALPDEYQAYISLEADAVSASWWSPELINGLLQSEGYATAVIQAHMRATSTLPPGELRRRVEARMRRQEILTRPDPMAVSFVLDEAVLLRRFGTNAVMHDQLTRLDEISQLPQVTLQILALEGNHPIGTGSFAILRFAPAHGASLDDVVYVEELSRSNYVEDENETYQYQLAFDRLQAEALNPDESRTLIARVARERWA